MPGAASLDLAWTAAGVFDGYFELALGPWDVAGGALLVREAGGIVTDWAGDDGAWLATGDIVAGRRRCTRGILELARELTRRRTAAASGREAERRTQVLDRLAQRRDFVAERGVDRVGHLEDALLGGDERRQAVGDDRDDEPALAVREAP